MRLRQVVIATSTLASSVASFERVLGVQVCHRDPSIATFGLENAMMAVGDTFLELLTPIRSDAAAARYLQRRGGDAGYMLCLQVDDLPSVRERVESLGVRIVNETDRETESEVLRGMHLHPRDIGGAIVALNIAIPEGSWEGAGPWHEWKRFVRDDVTTEIVGVEIGADDPELLSHRWSRVLDRPVVRHGDILVIGLDRGQCRFRAEPDPRRHGISGFDVTSRDPGEVLRRAVAEGLPVREASFDLAGVTINVLPVQGTQGEGTPARREP